MAHSPLILKHSSARETIYRRAQRWSAWVLVLSAIGNAPAFADDRHGDRPERRDHGRATASERSAHRPQVSAGPNHHRDRPRERADHHRPSPVIHHAPPVVHHRPPVVHYAPVHRHTPPVFTPRYAYDPTPFGVVPTGTLSINFQGGQFYFGGGFWYRTLWPTPVRIMPPLGILLPALPTGYRTHWHRNRPYYLLNGVYYAETGEGYRVVGPPEEEDRVVAAAPVEGDLVVYPREGQDANQMAYDRAECARWATEQSSGQSAEVFRKGMSACMDARGYTIR